MDAVVGKLLSSIGQLEKINTEPKIALQMLQKDLKEKGIEVEVDYEGIEDYSKFSQTTGAPLLENNIKFSRFNFGERAATFESAAVFPVVVNNRFVACIILFFKEKIEDSTFNTLRFLFSYLKYIFENQEMKVRTDMLINYYTSLFETSTPKLLVDQQQQKIIKMNKSAKDIADEETWLQFVSKDFASINGRYFKKREIHSGSSIFIEWNEVTKEEVLSYFKNLAENTGCFVVVKDGKIAEVSSNCVVEISQTPGVNFQNIIKEKEIAKSLEELDENKVFSSIATVLLPNSLERKVSIFAIKRGRYLYSFLVPAEVKYLLERAKKDFEEFFESISEPVYAITQDGTVVYANSSAKSIFGDIVGVHCRNIYPSENENELFKDIESVLHGEKIRKIESVRVSKENEKLLFSKTIVPFFDENGKLEKVYYILEQTYVTLKLKQLEREIEKKEKEIKELKKISELKSNFIYNISHDLKTPLTSIIGFTKLLYNEEFGKLNEQQKESLNTIMNETDRFIKLLNQILEVARIESKKIKLEMKETDIRTIIESPAVKTFEEMAKRKGLEFKVSIGENVPAIICDPLRISEALVNLVSNAVKFTKSGGITIKVFKSGKKYIRVEVIDTGIGIKEEDKKKLFKKFYQIERKSYAMQEGSGTGLGLSITKEIIKLHGGRIGVISEFGKGSTFWFTLPISGPKIKEK